jgi:hypothetical protein
MNRQNETEQEIGIKCYKPSAQVVLISIAKQETEASNLIFVYFIVIETI